MLVTDMIVEEAGEYLAHLQRHHLAPIFLAAPTSPDERLERIAAASQGICLRHLAHRHHRHSAVVGRQMQKALSRACADTRVYSDLPIAVGFGISNAEHFAAVGEFADAAVIGSALVRIIEQTLSGPPQKRRPAPSRDLSSSI